MLRTREGVPGLGKGQSEAAEVERGRACGDTVRRRVGLDPEEPGGGVRAHMGVTLNLPA